MRTITKIFIFSLFIILIFNNCSNNKVTESGHHFEFVIDKEGETAKEGDIVTYHLSQRDAENFSSSPQNIERPLKLLIPKKENEPHTFITEAILLMSEGDSLILEINSANISNMLKVDEGTEKVFFHIRVDDILSPEENKQIREDFVDKSKTINPLLQKEISLYKENKIDDLIQTKSGIQYRYHKKGKGNNVPQDGLFIIHYIGYELEKNTPFADSYELQKTLGLHLKRNPMIPAWKEIFPLLKVGDEISMYVPYEQAYGKAGNSTLKIGEESDLVFYIEILK